MVSFFFIFCDLLNGTRNSRGDAKFHAVTQTLRGSPRQRNSFEFFLSNASIIFFFNVTVEFYKKSSYFFLSFIF